MQKGAERDSDSSRETSFSFVIDDVAASGTGSGIECYPKVCSLVCTVLFVLLFQAFHDLSGLPKCQRTDVPMHDLVMVPHMQAVYAV